ncbi:hypothetical protein [Nonomuraea turkmeniaca]|uniref:hypothetical protein n=1 Tax=Nonomuraea turkmeniaca TaxID=103838 RepID=UPI003CCC6EFC
MKCADLVAKELARRSGPPSTMSLFVLVRHLDEEERHLFPPGDDRPGRAEAVLHRRGPRGRRRRSSVWQ